MPSLKWEKYISREPLRMIGTQPDLKGIEMYDVDGPKWDVPCIVHYSTIDRPIFLLKDPHSHPYPEFVCFIGGNSTKVRDFGAEIVMCMGPELEKHFINCSTVIFAPVGFPHCPLEITKVTKPIVLMTISLGKEYRQDIYKKNKP